jgi:hypothetical protein
VFVLICYLAAFIGVPALFLAGAPHWSRPRPTRGRRMAFSLVFGSAMAGLLTFGLIATALNFFNAWDTGLESVERSAGELGLAPLGGWGVLLLLVGVPWAFWAAVFGVLWTGEWIDRFRRMYKLLVAGTCLELLITIPVDVEVRRRTRCYCGEGTFFSLIIGVTMMFWTFGPGVVLLFLTRRMQRREALLRVCAKCGYDLRGLRATRCPECGTPFEPAKSDSAK